MRGLTAPPDLESHSAEEVLGYALERFQPRISLACSFQKEESVLLDMLLRLAPEARVFTIDTGVLFEETYKTWREIEERYGVKVEVFDALDATGGEWHADRCCTTQKVAALDRALEDLDAWITGVRREQSPTRASAAKLAWDEPHGLWKVNPLADWSEAQVWSYVRERDLPYHPLHNQGYASIGCAPCTQPGAGREGRWTGQDRLECGLHGEG